MLKLCGKQYLISPFPFYIFYFYVKIGDFIGFSSPTEWELPYDNLLDSREIKSINVKEKQVYFHIVSDEIMFAYTLEVIYVNNSGQNNSSIHYNIIIGIFIRKYNILICYNFLEIF